MTTEQKRIYDRKYAERPRTKLNKCVRSFLRNALHGRVKNSKWESILGFSVQEFRDHMESQFLPNMSFDNYGKWEIDHIVQLNKYDFACTDCKEFREAWALENLRPLWAYHNRKRKK